MTEPDWEAWEPAEPSSRFAERVMLASRSGGDGATARPSQSARRSKLAVIALGLAASLAFGGWAYGMRAYRTGAVVAETRQEVHVGRRALAVLEKGAHVTWDGDLVEQSEGEVFWRVEPGARLVVRTPRGEIIVTGTCFRSRVLKASGAVIVAVAVYEGRVRLAHGGKAVELHAGESGEADSEGVRRTEERESDDPRTRVESARAARTDEALHAMARLDRERTDHMRDQIHALLAGAAAEALKPAPSASARPFLPLPPADAGLSAGFSKEYIQQRIREDLFPLAKECYTNALAKTPGLAGKLVVSFRILGDRKVGGVVDDVEVTDDSTLEDEDMRTCVRESMMSVSFDPPPNDGEVTVRYPIIFSAESSDGGE